MTDTKSTTDAPKRGVLLRVQNGDVIGFDETGLRMNLADSVIADIQKRMTADIPQPVDASVLGDVNAWDVRVTDGWYLFHAHLPGKQTAGQFRRLVEAKGDEPPDIIADPSAALFGLLAIGGTRRAMGLELPIKYPYHVLAPGDDTGATGAAGTLVVTENDTVERLREQTRDTLIGEEIVARRMQAYRALPVFYVRGETDNASSVAGLIAGPALSNFRQTVANFCATADALGVPAKVLAVGLDFTLEAIEDDPVAWQDGIHQLMQLITDIFADFNLRAPLFISSFEAGTDVLSDHAVLRAQTDLAWDRAGHDFIFSAPSYMFALDEFSRMTPAAFQQIAEMDAYAIEAQNSDQPWSCPTFLLAEREDDPRVIRCRAQSMTGLVIDRDDPLNAGPSGGFSLEGCSNKAKIINIAKAPDDMNDILVTCDLAPEGDKLTLLYALACQPSTDGMPANRGAIRDTWHAISQTGITLHRWALPAAIAVH
ncbi:MAG: hypothetical protein ABJ327_11630 [Litoreibacter sp.]